MHVTVDNTEGTEGLNRRMRVEIPEDRIASEVDEQLKSIAPNVNIPGFRTGKVPAKLIAQRYGQGVRGDVVNKLLYSTFQQAITQEKLMLVDSPEVTEVKADPGQGLVYTTVFDVYPDLSLPALESLKIQRPVAEVTEEDVDKMLETLRGQAKTWSVVDRPATQGDRVMADFEGVVGPKPGEDTLADGNADENNADSDEPDPSRILKGPKSPVELGAGMMIEGFEEGLVGSSAGEERTLELKFPPEYHKSEFADCPVTFTVRIHSVEEAHSPETDEELAKHFGVEDGNIDTFRKETRDDLEDKLESGLRMRTNEQVVTALLEATPEVELPKSAITKEANAIVERQRQEFSMYGLDTSRLNMQPSQFEKQAHRQIILNLLMEKLVTTHRISLDEQKVRERVEAIAASYQEPKRMIAWYYEDRQRLNPVEAAVLQDQVVEWVLERADVTEEYISFYELMNPKPAESDANPEAETTIDSEADPKDSQADSQDT